MKRVDKMTYYPEGKCKLLRRKFDAVEDAEAAAKRGEIIEAKVILCDREHNLHVDLGAFGAVIPRCEGAVGISEGTTKDIALISRVNKYVCFRILGFQENSNKTKTALLSRKAVQEECINNYLDLLTVGDVADAAVTRLERFGAFIDIGAGINALIPIDMLSVSRINHPNERLEEGQKIRTVLRKKDGGKLTFSLRELLGTWEENASLFAAGDTVTGVIRSVEEYGVFVELAPNLAGLAELRDNLFVGQQVAVFVKSVVPEKMKIKLVIVEAFGREETPAPLTYRFTGTHMNEWHYSPKNCDKQIDTIFS